MLSPNEHEIISFFKHEVKSVFIIQMQKDGLYYIHPIAIGKERAMHGNTTIAETEEQASTVVHGLIAESLAEEAIVGVIHHRKNQFKFMRLSRTMLSQDNVSWSGGHGVMPLSSLRETIGDDGNEELVAMLNNRVPNRCLTVSELLMLAEQTAKRLEADTIEGPSIGGVN